MELFRQDCELVVYSLALYSPCSQYMFSHVLRHDALNLNFYVTHNNAQALRVCLRKDTTLE